MNVQDLTTAAVARAADLYLRWLGTSPKPPLWTDDPPGMTADRASGARRLLAKLGLVAPRTAGERARVTVTRAGLRRLNELRAQEGVA